MLIPSFALAISPMPIRGRRCISGGVDSVRVPGGLNPGCLLHSAAWQTREVESVLLYWDYS